ncbi:hypothetical protein M0804_000061 [Polistes exclamans]|nr:hypothetical protein M0804_000061 [Polistes exclamans]
MAELMPHRSSNFHYLRLTRPYVRKKNRRRRRQTDRQLAFLCISDLPLTLYLSLDSTKDKEPRLVACCWELRRRDGLLNSSAFVLSVHLRSCGSRSFGVRKLVPLPTRRRLGVLVLVLVLVVLVVLVFIFVFVVVVIVVDILLFSIVDDKGAMIGNRRDDDGGGGGGSLLVGLNIHSRYIWISVGRNELRGREHHG